MNSPLRLLQVSTHSMTWQRVSLWGELAPRVALITPLVSGHTERCPAPRRPVLFLLSRVLSLHSSDSSLISPLQIAGGFPRHASRREEPASILPLGPVHLLPSLFALLSAALPGRTIHHTHICLLPVPPPKPQHWQYLCLSPALSFSLTWPSVCPLYSSSWILMFFVSISPFFFWELMCLFFPHKLVLLTCRSFLHFCSFTHGTLAK